MNSPYRTPSPPPAKVLMPERVITFQDMDLTIALFQEKFGLVSNYLIEVRRVGEIEITFQHQPPKEFVKQLDEHLSRHMAAGVSFRIYCVKSTST